MEKHDSGKQKLSSNLLSKKKFQRPLTQHSSSSPKEGTDSYLLSTDDKFYFEKNQNERRMDAASTKEILHP